MREVTLYYLPVVPLHQDLAHTAALGICHVERNDITTCAAWISSVQVPGLGSGPDVDADSMMPLDEWSLASL